ncbi:GGDEF domain-containing protein [Rhizobiaceae bacterium BDR2-2]|uniref:diguanylate cyclase n=1 Tax=Ectorhizobium quercum TaxID=2965071 RepID=A0AAE3N218_9HYPH|nr:GGDEF domain-containing protein [Ectorhizobium quercum]MCX8997845.1 GGDEF domain-containing protein [Ectorhizobium quercum]
MVPVQTFNLLLFVIEAVIYFTVMLALLHFRKRTGLGVFLTALGGMHFLETYLAAVFYVSLPFGTVSPGSSVLFAGKLMLILLLYIKEDAETVRQPIYGLFLGNLLTVVLAFILQFHDVSGAPMSGDTVFVEEMGWLMLWGTTLLYLDSIAIILLYEKLGRYFPRRTIPRFLIAGAVLLTFDQIAFFGALHIFLGVPVEAFWGGWKAKMFSLVLYSGLYLVYRRLCEAAGPYTSSSRALSDVFGDLTFRERYQDLLERSGRDSLTGIFDRNRMEIDAPATIRACLQAGRPVSMVVLDVDHFKLVNDNFGHLQGDVVLKGLAGLLQATVRNEDKLYRFGGEEFIILLPGLDHEKAMALAERLRREVATIMATPDLAPVTISSGVATGPEDGGSFSELIASADGRLYRAKAEGRNCVRGQTVATADAGPAGA